MKAMLLKAANAPFELTEVPDPVAAPGEAVARVIACGSGLTIQHVKAGRSPAEFPRIIGHEFTGEIVALGAGVSGLAIGDGVTAYYYLNCGHCRWCLEIHGGHGYMKEFGVEKLVRDAAAFLHSDGVNRTLFLKAANFMFRD